jgi:hypothetical protein
MSRRRRTRGVDTVSEEAAILDRLSQRIDAWFPPPRSSAATVVVFVLQGLVGRASWMLGLLLMAFTAPWFVHPYRQAETMVAAAWHRDHAVATTVATVQRIELELSAPLDGRPGIDLLPSILMQRESEPGGLRYFPGGHWQAQERVLRDLPREFTTPFEVTPGWVLPWSAAPGLDLYWDEAMDAMLNLPRTVGMEHEPTARERALAAFDRPLDWLMARWMHPGTSTVTLQFDAATPDRVFAADALQHLPPRGGSGWAELLSALIMLVPSLPLWIIGSRLAARDLPVRHRHFATWVPLLLLPLWGTHYVDAMDRYVPDGRAIEREVRKALGPMQVLPASESLASAPARTLRLRLDAASSRFAMWLEGVDLTPPLAPTSADEAWTDLESRFTRRIAALDDERLVAMLDGVFAQDWYGGGLAPILLDGAGVASVAEGRAPEARSAARGFLKASLGADAVAPDLCHPGHAAFLARVGALQAHPDSEVAAAAKEREARERARLPERRLQRPGCARLDAGF